MFVERMVKAMESGKYPNPCRDKPIDCGHGADHWCANCRKYVELTPTELGSKPKCSMCHQEVPS
jgi:hypothetical protein